MAAHPFDDLKAALAELKARGTISVSIEALEQYLNHSQKSGSSDTSDKFQLAHYEAQAQSNLEMFRSVIEAGREALKALVLVNGGAVVAILGFIGATITKGLPSTLGLQLALPVLLFGLGVLSGALGFGARYVSQACYSQGFEKVGTTFSVGASVIAFVGYVLFGSGLYQSYHALVALFN